MNARTFVLWSIYPSETARTCVGPGGGCASSAAERLRSAPSALPRSCCTRARWQSAAKSRASEMSTTCWNACSALAKSLARRWLWPSCDHVSQSRALSLSERSSVAVERGTSHSAPDDLAPVAAPTA
eukprot:2285425-Pleurochrysis_carterae.AAC.1